MVGRAHMQLAIPASETSASRFLIENLSITPNTRDQRSANRAGAIHSIQRGPPAPRSCHCYPPEFKSIACGMLPGLFVVNWPDECGRLAAPTLANVEPIFARCGSKSASERRSSPADSRSLAAIVSLLLDNVSHHLAATSGRPVENARLRGAGASLPGDSAAWLSGNQSSMDNWFEPAVRHSLVINERIHPVH